MRTNKSKWYRTGRADVTRCPVIVMTRIGRHQCEMTAEYPHAHPVEHIEVLSSDRYEVQS